MRVETDRMIPVARLQKELTRKPPGTSTHWTVRFKRRWAKKLTPCRKTLSWGNTSETNWDSTSPDFISFMLSEKNTELFIE